MKKELIIVVEDEADIREVLEYNLEREGYKVLTVADGLFSPRLPPVSG